jgi:hypothetical protein
MSHRLDRGVKRAVMAFAMSSAVLVASDPKETPMDVARLQAFGRKYTVAAARTQPESQRSLRTMGSLKINDGAPAVSRTAITAAAQGFMTAFPDMDGRSQQIAYLSVEDYPRTLAEFESLRDG